MQASYHHYCVSLLLGVLLCAGVRADEAVEHSGVRHRGTLKREAGGWAFRDQDDGRVPMSRIAYIRFADGIPRTPSQLPAHSLLLADEQRVTGKLIAVSENKIIFAPSWGGAITLDRDKVIGLVQADSSLVVAREDFATPSKACTLLGSPTTESNALRFDAPVQVMLRSWKPGVRDGTVRMLVRSDGESPKLPWRYDIIGIDAKPSVVLDANGWRAINVKTAYPAAQITDKHRLLALELRDQRLRIYLDDMCLGETAIAPDDAITGILVSTDADGTKMKPGKFWLRELHAVRRVPFVTNPANDLDRDIMQLEHGEQIFGRVIAVDASLVQFGKRNFAWPGIRGIFFAAKNKSLVLDTAEVSFRPAPGFPVDTLRCELIRWEDGRLLVRHDLFGIISLTRGQLRRIRLTAK